MTTVWRSWFGSPDLRPLQAAAFRSCSGDAEFPQRLVTDADVNQSEVRLGFPLHRLFHLLDPVQKGDYIRGELLHYHGGFYLDTDVFCLRSLRSAHMASSAFEASGATLKTEYDRRHNKGPAIGNPFENNALGPVRPNTTYTRWWHSTLMQKMDKAEARLTECARQYPDGQGGIVYRDYLRAGRNKCGFEWGAMVNFKKDVDWQLSDRGAFGRALQLCNGAGKLLGLPSANGTGECDVLHVGTAASWANPPWVQQLADTGLCRRYPVLSLASALNCTPATSERSQSGVHVHRHGRTSDKNVSQSRQRGRRLSQSQQIEELLL